MGVSTGGNQSWRQTRSTPSPLVGEGWGGGWLLESASNIDPRPQPLPTIRAFTPVFDGLWGRGAHRARRVMMCLPEREAR